MNHLTVRKLSKWKSGVPSSKLDGRKIIESREKKSWWIFRHQILPRKIYKIFKVWFLSLKRTVISNVMYVRNWANSLKPFHVGHLRSTITGQAVCNLLSTEHDVHRNVFLNDAAKLGFSLDGWKSKKIMPLTLSRLRYFLTI